MKKVIEVELLKKLNVEIKNKDLYETAFSHTSYANENNVESYERLEFLGDAILEYLMSDYLYKLNKYSEGEMTKIRAHYVCEKALYRYSIDLGLNEYLKLGRGEEENDGKHSQAIVADIFESFLGALYLDQGMNKAKEFFEIMVIPLIKSHEIDFFADYKSQLQEYVQTGKKSLEYKITKETGPAHNKEFTSEVSIDGIVYGMGIGSSKKSAEQAAAKNALQKAQKGSLIWEEHMK